MIDFTAEIKEVSGILSKVFDITKIDFVSKIKEEYLSEDLKKIILIENGKLYKNQKNISTATFIKKENNNEINNDQKFSIVENEIEFSEMAFSEFSENEEYYKNFDNVQTKEEINKSGLEVSDDNNNINNNNFNLGDNSIEENQNYSFENSEDIIENYKFKIDSSESIIWVKNPGNNQVKRTWNDHLKNLNVKKGKFSKEETILLIKEIIREAYRGGYSPKALMTYLLNRKTRSEYSIWPKVSAALPNRSIKSISDYCHRILSPFNNKGNWDEGEIKKLIELYNELGGRWKPIGDILQRHPENVRDKWKNLYNVKTEGIKINIDKPWDLSMTLKLLKYVNDYITDGGQVNILKYGYKFSKMFKNKDYDGDRYLDLGEEVLFIDIRNKKFSQKKLVYVKNYIIFIN